MERYLCIHAHFYQPPRENPWLEAIEVQDSAYPYHDWNERVSAECYAPNALCRILDGEGRITEIVNNYSKISFDFGPTLLSWLQEKAPKTYQAILTADQESKQGFSGHGAALAQAYNHMILPLANSRDKSTQVLWGIRDFEHRFSRAPEGMWLPEAAVDLETLEALARHGISFTILSPYTAKRVRPLGGRAWRDVSEARIDPSMAYKVRLPSGNSINVFFYDGPVSQAVAFEKLLERGEDFANRLLGAFSDSRTGPQLVHIASDGETYGHHHAFGDMALAYALRTIESGQQAKLAIYGEFLEKHPATHEAQIFENSSWSCSHGVERWRSNCGCNSGTHLGWHQEWRAPLREALDWLRDTLAPAYEAQAGALFKDPWAARDDYIQVILNRSPENVQKFFHQHGTRDFNEEENIRALKLLELQRHAMLMYTSCGWFFDELSGLETVQAIQYAGRAVQLAEVLRLGDRVESQFVDRLAKAQGSVPEHGDGRQVYEQFVKPAALDLLRVGAHYGLSSLFENYESQSHIYCYSLEQEDQQTLTSGKTKLVMGRSKISSDITWESAQVTFGFAYLGDHTITGGVREFGGEQVYQATSAEIIKAFEQGDFPELIRVLDREFGSGTYSLKLLFRDEQRKILRLILDSALTEAEAAYRDVYQNRAPLMHFLASLGMPPVRAFQIASEFTLNADIRRAIQADDWNPDVVKGLVEEAKKAKVYLDATTLEFTLRRKLERLADQFREQPTDLALLQSLDAAVGLAQTMPFKVQLWEIQNIFYEVLKSFYPPMTETSGKLDENAEQWVSTFRSLGQKLAVRVE